MTEAELRYHREWRKRNKGKCHSYTRKNELKRNFGMSLEEYEAMFRAQGGVCRICGKPETSEQRPYGLKRLAVDHDHRTGEVRGLLCNRCNLLIGQLEKNQEVLWDAFKYLEW